MSQELPAIRKTKKSSYKPLSKLNEDHLTELKRLEKPEYASKVFFYNTAVRSQLENNVNVWFRDHQHNMALINRQQRAILNLMCRVQRDKHRVKKTGYQRKQQEIRDNMKRLQEELLQRRVIQKFRRNADKKMAARGLKSLAGLKLTAQLRSESAENLDHFFADEEPEFSTKEQAPNPAALLESIVDYAAIVTENTEEGLDKSNVPEHRSTSQVSTSVQNSSRRETSFPAIHKPQNQALHKGRGQGRDGKCGRSSPPSKQQATAAVISATKSSNPHSMFSKDLEASDSSANMFPGSGTKSGQKYAGVVHRLEFSVYVNPVSERAKEKYCGGRTEQVGSDSVKRSDSVKKSDSVEKSVLFPHLGDTSARHSPQSAQSPNHSVVQFPVFMDTRVIEVRKSKPGSSAVVVQTRRRDSIPMMATSRTMPPSALQHALSTLHDSTTSTTTTAHPPFPAKTQEMTLEKIQEKTQEKIQDKVQGEENSRLVLNRTGDTAEREVRGRGGPEGGKGSITLASRVRLERQQAAKRRAQMLDAAPLTQYYRSSRGTLQPLLTKPDRYQFSKPTGRHKYRQGKLLRQEQQKHLERQRHIQDFFTDLSSRRIGMSILGCPSLGCRGSFVPVGDFGDSFIPVGMPGTLRMPVTLSSP
ncbi:hypothetical protein ACOMHN_033301 [Nucella lapillus]